MRAVFLLHRQVKAKQELLIYYLIQIFCVYDLKIFSEKNGHIRQVLFH